MFDYFQLEGNKNTCQRPLTACTSYPTPRRASICYVMYSFISTTSSCMVQVKVFSVRLTASYSIDFGFLICYDILSALMTLQHLLQYSILSALIFDLLLLFYTHILCRYNFYHSFINPNFCSFCDMSVPENRG